MKVHQLIDTLNSLDPDMDIRGLVADENHISIFDSKTVANVIVNKETVMDDQVDARSANHPAYRGRKKYKKAIWHVYFHGFWDADV